MIVEASSWTAGPIFIDGRRLHNARLWISVKSREGSRRLVKSVGSNEREEMDR
jgi:hypothetical protein